MLSIVVFLLESVCVFVCVWGGGGGGGGGVRFACPGDVP